MVARVAASRLRALKDPTLRKQSKKLFWMWVAYQTIKGTLTTSLIWIPLMMSYWD